MLACAEMWASSAGAACRLVAWCVAQLELLSRAYHPHLVALLGFCVERGNQILVYEFMSRGTVRDHLYGQCSLGSLCVQDLFPALGTLAGIPMPGQITPTPGQCPNSEFEPMPCMLSLRGTALRGQLTRNAAPQIQQRRLMCCVGRCFGEWEKRN